MKLKNMKAYLGPKHFVTLENRVVPATVVSLKNKHVISIYLIFFVNKKSVEIVSTKRNCR